MIETARRNCPGSSRPVLIAGDDHCAVTVLVRGGEPPLSFDRIDVLARHLRALALSQ